MNFRIFKENNKVMIRPNNSRRSVTISGLSMVLLGMFIVLLSRQALAGPLCELF